MNSKLEAILFIETGIRETSARDSKDFIEIDLDSSSPAVFDWDACMPAAKICHSFTSKAAKPNKRYGY